MSVIRLAKHPKVAFWKQQWEHEKCHPMLHVWKRSSEDKDKCYCGRKTLKATMRAFVFIEAR